MQEPRGSHGSGTLGGAGSGRGVMSQRTAGPQPEPRPGPGPAGLCGHRQRLWILA